MDFKWQGKLYNLYTKETELLNNRRENHEGTKKNVSLLPFKTGEKLAGTNPPRNRIPALYDL